MPPTSRAQRIVSFVLLFVLAVGMLPGPQVTLAAHSPPSARLSDLPTPFSPASLAEPFIDPVRAALEASLETDAEPLASGDTVPERLDLLAPPMPSAPNVAFPALSDPPARLHLHTPVPTTLGTLTDQQTGVAGAEASEAASLPTPATEDATVLSTRPATPDLLSRPNSATTADFSAAIGTPRLVAPIAATAGQTSPTAVTSSTHSLFLPFISANVPNHLTISPSYGGQLISTDGILILSAPAEAVESTTTITYRPLPSPVVGAGRQTLAAFELSAVDTASHPVNSFKRPLTLQLAYPAYPGLDELGLTALFSRDGTTWSALPAGIDTTANRVIVRTDHFTRFAVVADVESDTVIVNDRDPGFMHDYAKGWGPNHWADANCRTTCWNADAFWTYNRSAANDGPLTQPVDWATWTPNLPKDGYYYVAAWVPAIAGQDIPPAPTARATYRITHADDVTNVQVNQAQKRGSWVQLGAYRFTAGSSGSVYLNDVVPEQGKGQVYVGFDAVRFLYAGTEPPPPPDTEPPTIDYMDVTQDAMGGVLISARVTDNVGVDRVTLFANGVAYPMQLAGGDIYQAVVRGELSRRSDSYVISASDLAGNTAYFPPDGAVSLAASQARNFGLSGCITSKQAPRTTGGVCRSPGYQGTASDPVNTQNGNFVEVIRDLLVTGVGDSDIEISRAYNSLAAFGTGGGTIRFTVSGGSVHQQPIAGPALVFGPGWSFNYAVRLLRLNNPLLDGAQIFYPDGRVVSFRRDGAGFTPITPLSFDLLTATGSGYELRNQLTLQVDVFDAAGRLVERRDRNGNRVRLLYTGDRIRRIENDSGRWVELGYTSEGLLATIDAPEGRHIRYGYTSGLLTSVTDGRGNTTTYAYSGRGQLEQIMTPKGHPQLRMRYDSDDRVAEQIVGTAERYTMTYSADSQLTTVTDSYNHISRNYYDDRERLVRSEDGLGHAEEYGYDQYFNRIYLKDRLGREYTYTYDSRGNRRAEDSPLGWHQEWDYNALDRLTRAEDTEGRETRYQYDPRGNLTQITNAAQNSSTITYDGRGLPIEVRDFNGDLTVNTYDPITGDLVKTRNGAGDEATSAYDGLGRVHTRTNGRGFTTTFIYDGNDNLVQLDGPLGFRLGYTYDKNNNPETATDANGGIVTYIYDTSENLIEERNQLGFTTRYGFDDMNNLVRIEDAEGRVWTYDYDAVYNRVAEHGPEDTHTFFTYNAVRKVTDIARCNRALVSGACATRQVRHLVYDDLDRVSSETANYIPGAPPSSDTNVTTAYAYDKVDNLRARTDANGNTTRYNYDALNRLTREETAAQQVTMYAYDGMGNLIKFTTPRGNVSTFTYDGANRLATATDALNQTTRYAYDHNGNLTTQTDPLGIVTRYAYDALDRLTALTRNERPSEPSDSARNVTTRFGYDLQGNLRFVYDPRGGYVTEHQYDAAHRRVLTIDAEGGRTAYAYDKVNNLTAVTDANGHTTTTAYDGLNRRTSVTNPEQHRVSFTYDRLGNLLTLTDARGNASSYHYDGMNRVVSYTDAAGGVWSYTYDPVGNPLVETDANGHANTFVYDVVYRLLRRTDAEGLRTAWTYDANGNALTRTDGNGHVTTSTYDALDRLATRTNAEGETTAYTYDWQGDQIAMTEADGVVTAYAYDPLYRLAIVTENAQPGQPETADINVITRYAYDAAGNLVEISDANGNPTRFAFDGLNRLVREVDAIGNTWDYTYDKVRNRVARVDALRNRTAYAYYDDDQLKRIDYQDSTFVAYTYDQNNNPLSVANELGTTRRSYDKLNQLTEEIDVFGRRTAFAYDPVGNRLAISYPDGRTVSSSYYKNDWLKTTTDPEGRVTTYTRDRVGNLVRQDNPNSTIVTQTYDKADRLLTLENRQVGGAGTVNSRFVYSYDTVGQRITMEATYTWRQPAVETSRYSYDPLRRLVRDEDSQGRWTAYTFDRVGNRLTLTTNDDSLSSRPFDAKTLSYSYNAINQLLTVVGDTRPGSAGVQRTDNVAQPIHAFRHEVAAQQGKGISGPAAAELLARADALLAALYGTPAPNGSAVADAVAAIRTQVQAYQAQGALRNDGIATSLLAKLKLADDANTGASGDLQAVTYTYDANGNRINKEFPGPRGPHVQGTDYGYDPENRLVRAQDYQQNLQGNRVDRAVTTMDYDGEGRRLVKIYDPKDGSGGTQRVEYVFDGLLPIAEYNTQNPQYDNYYRGDMGRILELHHFPSGTAGQAYWYHYDGLGSVAGLTKQDGQSSHNYRYEPYGQIEVPNGNFTDPHNHYTFTGQEWDEHTGLYDFFARQYDPDAGVWLTQDPYRGQIGEPRSLHRLGYVEGNPVNLIDLYGFQAQSTATNQTGCGINRSCVSKPVTGCGINQSCVSKPAIGCDINQCCKANTPSSPSSCSSPADKQILKKLLEMDEERLSDLERQQKEYRQRAANEIEALKSQALQGVIGYSLSGIGFVVSVGGFGTCAFSLGAGCVLAAGGGALTAIGGGYIGNVQLNDAQSSKEEAKRLEQEANNLQPIIDKKKRDIEKLKEEIALCLG